MSIEGKSLVGKTVRLRQEFFHPSFQAGQFLFKCEEGFGCYPFTSGRKISGTWLHDGKRGLILRSDVEAIVEADVKDASGGPGAPGGDLRREINDGTQ
jgi:hypothetical protein